MVRIKEALVVEGRYDKNTLAQVVEAPIFVTNGFGIFKDPETLALLRAVAEKRGLIVLTDSDGGGLVIRNHLRGAIDPALVKHAYIPDVPGKERRKAAPGKEGKLGVEGMPPEVLLAALRSAGATFLEDEPLPVEHAGTSIARPGAFHLRPSGGVGDGRTSDACPYEQHTPITKTDLYELGLSGQPESKERRLALQKRLGLPENLSANALLTALNCITTREELSALLNR